MSNAGAMLDPTLLTPQIDVTFVPACLTVRSYADVEAYFEQLLGREVRTREELERWLADRSELAAACGEARANLYISMTCDTSDATIASAFTRFVEEVDPKLKVVGFELDKRLVQLADQIGLPDDRYGVLLRATRADVALFREENVAIETTLDLLTQKFEALTGAMTVTFEGIEKTLPQMAPYQESTDRGLRERAWRTVAERRLRERDALDTIYDEMVSLRTTLAKNAGHADYVSYTFQAKHRFDYGPRECEAFHAGVEKHVMPLVRSLERSRASALGLERLRPWDLAVDVRGRAPLRPFSGGKELVDKSVAAMRSLDPRLAAMLSSMGTGEEARGARDGASLDLDSRKGKAPGGYQYMRDRSRRPFIFMNAAGLHSDAVTMVHEAGHAFHSMLCVKEPLVEYRSSPIEFAEVASMGMELLSMHHWHAPGSFYAARDEDYARAKREQLKRGITILPWIATIDAFQLAVYRTPAMGRDGRTGAWLDLDRRFGAGVDWSGLEATRESLWQRQLHPFSVPLYYIEYGIAQMGAMQLWLLAKDRGERVAIDHYMRALALGGSKPLPELFQTAGLTFDFGEATIGRLVDAVAKELERLPE